MIATWALGGATVPHSFDQTVELSYRLGDRPTRRGSSLLLTTGNQRDAMIEYGGGCGDQGRIVESDIDRMGSHGES